MKKIYNFIRAIINPYNLLAVSRTFIVIKNPLKFLVCFFIGAFPKSVSVRTPTGIFSIKLRNYESLKTVFSIFVREDYKTPLVEQTFIDIGSNVGVSAVYFLSRNLSNRVVCVEPDPSNNIFLQENISHFPNRYFCISEACAAHHHGQLTFYLSEDGKYNSLIPIPDSHSKIIVNVVPVSEIFDKACQTFPSNKFTLKIDIEGTEKEVLSAIADRHVALIDRIYVEALGVKKCLSGNWHEQVRAGYVTILKRDTIEPIF